jgi:phosphatidylglycerol:prolipoprotein diacylglycerol transferase
MHPVAFTTGGYSVRFAGLMYVVAVIIALAYAYRVARKKHWDSQAVLPGVALTVTAAYLGARLHGAASDWPRFSLDPLGEMLRPGSLSFFGGMTLGVLVMLVYLRLARLPLGETTDALAPVAPILYAVFRVGCFLNGDDYGLPTSLPWGMSFPRGSPPVFEPVHPTQLYEIALMIPVMGVLLWRRRVNTRPGELAFDLCILMGLERFVVEFWRSGIGGSSYFGLAQWLAVLVVCAGLAGRVFLMRSEPHGDPAG